MRALFLPRYGALAGSSRYMSYDYIPHYQAAGIQCTVSPLLDDRYMLLSKESASRRSIHFLGAVHLAKQVIKRIIIVLKAARFDVIVLEKDVIPYFPSLFERVLFYLSNGVILMLDEPTYSFYRNHPNKLIRMWAGEKIERTIKKSSGVIAWNDDVARYAGSLNSNVVVVNTGIDLERYRIKQSFEVKGRPIRIGWIGTPSGFAFLHSLDSVLAKLAKQHDLELFVVSSEAYQAAGFNVVNCRWNINSEIDALLTMDIGVMPLPDTPWAAGKSGCKMFQYMGAGIPALVSPVGINRYVIKNGVNGLIARTQEEWSEQLNKLIASAELRRRLGLAGREYVALHNSQSSTAQKLIEFLSEVYDRRRLGGGTKH